MDSSPNVFRASYSVLNAWKQGNWQRAIEMYFKLTDFVTPQMAEGKAFHKQWEEYIIKNQALPPEFGDKKLIKPLPEFKTVVQIHPWLRLVGIVDCLDAPTIYEFKTGKRSSEKYANDFQTGVYGIIATMSGYFVDRAEIFAYDQYKKSYDWSMLWLTDKYLKDSLEWVETISSEMFSYFEENKLFEKYGKKEAIVNGTS